MKNCNNLLIRFISKIEIIDYCWNWKGGKFESGYGVFTIKNKTVRAHRYSYELFKGKIPKGLQIDHLCRNRACCNPNHLEAVTPRENTLRGNGLASINAKKTHCPQGHPYSGDNLTIWGKNKGRNCLQCKRNYDLSHPRIRRKHKGINISFNKLKIMKYDNHVRDFCRYAKWELVESYAKFKGI